MEGDLYGGNMLLSRGLVEGASVFREDLGKGAVGYCEDTELSRRLRALGIVVFFAPGAVQKHVIGPDRMTPSFMRKTSFEKGLSDGFVLEDGTPLLGASYRALADAWRNSLRAVRALVHSDDHARMVAEVRALYELGRLFGYARRWRVRREAP